MVAGLSRLYGLFANLKPLGNNKNPSVHLMTERTVLYFFCREHHRQPRQPIQPSNHKGYNLDTNLDNIIFNLDKINKER